MSFGGDSTAPTSPDSSYNSPGPREAREQALSPGFSNCSSSSISSSEVSHVKSCGTDLSQPLNNETLLLSSPRRDNEKVDVAKRLRGFRKAHRKNCGTSSTYSRSSSLGRKMSDDDSSDESVKRISARHQQKHLEEMTNWAKAVQERRAKLQEHLKRKEEEESKAYTFSPNITKKAHQLPVRNPQLMYEEAKKKLKHKEMKLNRLKSKEVELEELSKVVDRIHGRKSGGNRSPFTKDQLESFLLRLKDGMKNQQRRLEKSRLKNAASPIKKSRNVSSDRLKIFFQRIKDDFIKKQRAIEKHKAEQLKELKSCPTINPRSKKLKSSTREGDSTPSSTKNISATSTSSTKTPPRSAPTKIPRDSYQFVNTIKTPLPVSPKQSGTRSKSPKIGRIVQSERTSKNIAKASGGIFNDDSFSQEFEDFLRQLEDLRLHLNQKATDSFSRECPYHADGSCSCSPMRPVNLESLWPMPYSAQSTIQTPPTVPFTNSEDYNETVDSDLHIITAHMDDLQRSCEAIRECMDNLGS